MKQYLLFMLALTSVLLAHAQNPGIPYQATLLAPETQLPGANSGLIPLKNTDVCLRFTFKSASGTEYQETQTATTSEFGRIDLVIGNGTPLSGSFAGINWDGNPKTMEVDIDYKGLCANFEPLAINEFQYVPYAFFALNAGGGSTTPPTITATANPTIPGDLTIGTNNLLINVDDADSDPTNEIELPLTAAINQVLTWDGSAWVAKNNPVDADSDPTNEIQDLTITGNTLKITGNTSATDIDLTPYLDNTDNQIIVSADTGNLITAGTDLGALITSIDDADADPANEIQDLTITGNTLKITGNASATDINLAPYLDNTDNQIIVSADTGNLITAGTDLGALITSLDDADADPANEIQDLAITANVLKITGNASATDIDLTPYLDNTDNQTATDVAFENVSSSLTSTNVQTAIEELDTQIVSTNISVLSNTNEINDLTTLTGTLSSTIETNQTNILANTNSITANTSGINDLVTLTGTLSTTIATNQSNILANTNSITANTSGINDLVALTGTLSTTIAANQTNILTNTNSITANTSGINNLVALTGTLSATIAANQTNILTNTNSITANTTGINDLVALTGTLSTTIDTNQTNILANTNSITSLENNKVSKSGDVMTGTLSMTNSATIDMGGSKITNLDTPIDDGDAVNKAYVDSNYLKIYSTGVSVSVITADKLLTESEIINYSLFYCSGTLNITIPPINPTLIGKTISIIEAANSSGVINIISQNIDFPDIGLNTANGTFYETISLVWDGTGWRPFR